jgi:hypothetical protein
MSTLPIQFEPTMVAIPFPYLANVIRHSTTEQAIDIFKAVTQLASHTRHFKTVEEFLSAAHKEVIKRRLKQKYSVWETATPPPVLSLLDAEKVFEFVYQYNDYTDEAWGLMDAKSADFSLTEEWLVRCVLHPEADSDGELRRVWSRYLLRQPHYLIKSAKEYFEEHVHRAMKYGTFRTSSFGLETALRPFVSRENHDPIGILHVLTEWMRLGATAAVVWDHQWREHGIVRGSTLPLDGQVDEVLCFVEEYYKDRINKNWQDMLPFYIHRLSSKMNLGGEFLILLNFVFPIVIAHTGSTIREVEFAAAIQRWIIAAATAPNVDPEGRVAELIREHGMAPESAEALSYSTYTTGLSIIEYPPPEGNFVVVELIPYGPRNKVENFTEQIVYPSHSSICTICGEEFGSDVEESSCRQLEVCKHSFHWECLDGWINASHTGDVGCPNCREPICGARRRRPKRR